MGKDYSLTLALRFPLSVSCFLIFSRYAGHLPSMVPSSFHLLPLLLVLALPPALTLPTEKVTILPTGCKHILHPGGPRPPSCLQTLSPTDPCQITSQVLISSCAAALIVTVKMSGLLLMCVWVHLCVVNFSALKQKI